MPLSQELSVILTKAGTPAEFATWLEREGCVECDDLALMASAEEKVEAKIINACAAKVTNARDAGCGVRITKAWRSCSFG